MKLAVLTVALVLTGCTFTGPVHIVCKGKGNLSFQGGPYAGAVQGDCGDGFEYHRNAEEK